VVKPDGIPLSSVLFWTGNALGILIFTPLVLRIDQIRRDGALFKPSPIEVLWILILTCVVSFGFLIPNTAHTGLIAVAYLSFPLLVWLSFSWRRNVIWPLALVTTLMTALTATGHGPLQRANPLATYAEMTIFITIYGLSCLILMAAVEERALQQHLALEHRLSSQQKEAQLRNLRSHLNPHFLFNSLNMLKSLIVEDAGKAQHAVISLADLLRFSLRATRQNLILLREELSVIRSFLDLQKMRYEGRLHVVWSIEAEAEGTMVPPMLFQQLVENAVKHGIDSSTSGGEVRVEALLEKDHLLLFTINPGTYTEGPHDGFGLRSVREQLDSLYGSAATFHIDNTPEGMVKAEIRIPLRVNG
jgi:sensor histidine kinase YesM